MFIPLKTRPKIIIQLSSGYSIARVEILFISVDKVKGGYRNTNTKRNASFFGIETVDSGVKSLN